MGVETNVLGYFAGVGLIAVVVGLAIGYVARAATTRRKVEPLKAEVSRLKTELADMQQRREVAGEEPPAPAARRLTPTELVAILGAVGTLISTTAAFYNNYQGRSLKESQEKLATAEAKQKNAEGELDKLRTNVRMVLGFGVEKWLQLDKSPLPPQRPKRPESFQVSDRDVTGSCSDERVQLTYNGYAPSILRCKERVVLRLSQATRVMLAPEVPAK